MRDPYSWSAENRLFSDSPVSDEQRYYRAERHTAVAKSIDLYGRRSTWPTSKCCEGSTLLRTAVRYFAHHRHFQDGHDLATFNAQDGCPENLARIRRTLCRRLHRTDGVEEYYPGLPGK